MIVSGHTIQAMRHNFRLKARDIDLFLGVGGIRLASTFQVLLPRRNGFSFKGRKGFGAFSIVEIYTFD